MTKDNWRRSDLVAGALMILVGALFGAEALNYPMGSSVRAGPGFFPFGLSLIMITFGVGIILIDARRPANNKNEDELPVGWRARPLVALPLSILVFAVVVPRYGLWPATFLAVLVSTFADRDIGPAKAVIVALLMSTLCILIFRVGLGVQARAFIW